MQFCAHWTGLVVTAFALLSAGYAFAVVCLAGRFRKAASRMPAKCPPVTLLKPLHFDEPRLKQNLESFCAQDYAGPVQIVFGVQDPLDPAIRIVESLKREHPELDIEL